MSTRGRRTRRIERGSRDRRLLPVAISVWAACLIAHALFDICMTNLMNAGGAIDDADKTAIGMAAGTAATVTAQAAADGTGVIEDMPWKGIPPLAIAMMAIIHAGAGTAWAIARRCARNGIGRTTLIVCIMAALLACTATWSRQSAAWSDPAATAARAGPARASVTGRITAPLQTSFRREYDCQAPMRLDTFTQGRTTAPSHAQVRIFATGRTCTQLHRGATYRVRGHFAEADIGSIPLWLTMDEQTAPALVKAQPWHERWRERIQESFLRATEGLTIQGRVLVPGITMGLLGHDHAAIRYTSANPPIDDTYAQRVEDAFRTAGIMHLMAVSGGHFVLIATLIRRACALLLLDRRIVAVTVAAAYTLLAALMMPADSVNRALAMGWISACALFLGRRPQALSGLSVTVTAMLLLDPTLARSYGFALSCAAVLGIILLSPGIGRTLALLLPDALADMTAMTVAAQIATLPIQVMMEPQLPVWSVPANLLAAPVVSCSTMLGLAGLMTAWVVPQIGVACAWAASCGTLVLERVAMWLGSGSHATVPWAGGIGGAASLALLEAAAIASVMAIRRRFDASHAVHALPGEPFVRNPRNRMGIWWADTKRLVERWEE